MKTVCYSICAFAALSIGVFACSKKSSVNDYDCTGLTPTYTNNVKAILDAKCATAGCHSSSASAAGIDLSNHGQAKSHSNHSSFIGSIEHSGGYDPMPKGGTKLSADEIRTIACWAQNGSPN
jgi:hypothetical protein